VARAGHAPFPCQGGGEARSSRSPLIARSLGSLEPFERRAPPARARGAPAPRWTARSRVFDERFSPRRDERIDESFLLLLVGELEPRVRDEGVDGREDPRVGPELRERLRRAEAALAAVVAQALEEGADDLRLRRSRGRPRRRGLSGAVFPAAGADADRDGAAFGAACIECSSAPRASSRRSGGVGRVLDEALECLPRRVGRDEGEDRESVLRELEALRVGVLVIASSASAPRAERSRRRGLRPAAGTST